jgi:hypothetical protein
MLQALAPMGIVEKSAPEDIADGVGVSSAPALMENALFSRIAQEQPGSPLPAPPLAKRGSRGKPIDS